MIPREIFHFAFERDERGDHRSMFVSEETRRARSFPARSHVDDAHLAREHVQTSSRPSERAFAPARAHAARARFHRPERRPRRVESREKSVDGRLAAAVIVVVVAVILVVFERRRRRARGGRETARHGTERRLGRARRVDGEKYATVIPDARSRSFASPAAYSAETSFPVELTA